VGGIRPSDIFDEDHELPVMTRLFIDADLVCDQASKEAVARENAATGGGPKLPTTVKANAAIDSIHHPEYDRLERARREAEDDPILIKG